MPNFYSFFIKKIARFLYWVPASSKFFEGILNLFFTFISCLYPILAKLYHGWLPVWQSFWGQQALSFLSNSQVGMLDFVDPHKMVVWRSAFFTALSNAWNWIGRRGIKWRVETQFFYKRKGIWTYNKKSLNYIAFIMFQCCRIPSCSNTTMVCNHLVHGCNKKQKSPISCAYTHSLCVIRVLKH